MLGAYEDSDEEDSGNVCTSAANSQINPSADIDSTLANFMAVSIHIFLLWLTKFNSIL